MTVYSRRSLYSNFTRTINYHFFLTLPFAACSPTLPPPLGPGLEGWDDPPGVKIAGTPGSTPTPCHRGQVDGGGGVG